LLGEEEEEEGGGIEKEKERERESRRCLPLGRVVVGRELVKVDEGEVE